MSKRPALITIIARWRARLDQEDQIIPHLNQLRLSSLQEPGCLAYEVHQNLHDPRSFVLVERYQDQAALEAHLQSEHFRHLVLETIVPRLEMRIVDRILNVSEAH